MMRHLLLLLTFIIWIPASAQATAEGGKAHSAAPAVNPGPGGTPDQPFDDAAALKYSQAAIGRILDGHTLRDREGRAVKLADYRGKPLVISLIYTSCYHICPTTTQHLARAVKSASSAVGAEAFTVVTIGFDVRNDTPERMGAWARQQGVGGDEHWLFLSVDEADIAPLAANLGFLFVPSSKGFDHLLQTTVVDADGKIHRQIYGMDFNPGYLVGAMQELVLGRVEEALSLSAMINKVRLFCTKYDPATDTYRFDYAMILASGIGVVLFALMGFVVARVWRKRPSPDTP